MSNLTFFIVTNVSCKLEAPKVAAMHLSHLFLVAKCNRAFSNGRLERWSLLRVFLVNRGTYLPISMNEFIISLNF